MIEQKMNACSQPKGLDAEALAAITVLARLGEPDRRKAVHALGYTEMRRIWTPRDPKSLPSLTRLVPERDRSAIYASPEWAAYRRDRTGRRLHPADLRAGGAVLASRGGPVYARWARRPLRISHAASPISDRPNTAPGSADRGATSAPKASIIMNPRRASSSPSRIPRAPSGCRASGSRSTSPRGRMTPDEFEAALNRRLLPIRLQSIADSATGRELCARTGVDPRELRRFYQRGTGFRAATELTALRPQADTGALGRLCSDIVIDVVLGLDAQRPVR